MIKDTTKKVPLKCSTAVGLFRGLYARVAKDLRVDNSYVSRVARGERRAKAVEKALDREFARIVKLISRDIEPK
jgi:hypothetical protein